MDSRAVTAFYEIINGNLNADHGKFDWGLTTTVLLPLDNDAFDSELSLVDWLRQWAKSEEEKRCTLEVFG